VALNGVPVFPALLWTGGLDVRGAIGTLINDNRHELGFKIKLEPRR
jgi:hypothetical protein